MAKPSSKKRSAAEANGEQVSKKKSVQIVDPPVEKASVWKNGKKITYSTLKDAKPAEEKHPNHKSAEGPSKSVLKTTPTEEKSAFDDQDEFDFANGFDSDEDDESDDDEQEPAAKPELPPIPQEPKIKKKLEKANKQPASKKGVIYLGRIPHGFHEEELQEYFSQFGDVTRLRLSRNKKTGRSKHYAFIEFEHESVAAIVAETMHNYLLAGHIMQCKIVPQEKVHPKLWVGAGRQFKPMPKGRAERVKHNAPKTDEQKTAISAKLIKSDEKRREKLASMGIEYEFEGYQESAKRRKSAPPAPEAEGAAPADDAVSPPKAKKAKKDGAASKKAKKPRKSV